MFLLAEYPGAERKIGSCSYFHDAVENPFEDARFIARRSRFRDGNRESTGRESNRLTVAELLRASECRYERVRDIIGGRRFECLAYSRTDKIRESLGAQKFADGGIGI